MSLLAGRRAVGIEFDREVTVRVPATSANLGPGFDSFGLAFEVYDQVTVQACERLGADVAVEGCGAGVVALDETHLVVRSLRSGLAHAGVEQPGLRLCCLNEVPHGRGLGSSSAAILAGLLAARGLLTDPELLDDATVFDLAAAAEGHPDNAAATLFGGFTVAWTEPGHPNSSARAVRLEVDPRVQVVVCVPDGELATSRARAMLPTHVEHGAAAFNAGRAGLLVEALTRSPELLLPATEDRLHQAQRASAMPQTDLLLRAVREAGGAAVVSGAGPSVLVLGAGDLASTAVGAAFAACGDQVGSWTVRTPAVDVRGGTTTTKLL